MSDRPHWYLSTACQHDRCSECRLRCKFCDGPCACFCHRPVEPEKKAS